jgi:hypothetical protein
MRFFWIQATAPAQAMKNMGPKAAAITGLVTAKPMGQICPLAASWC